MTETPLLAIENLSISVGAKSIVKNLFLQVNSGEILGLVGASGSGKSMTALAIMRLLPAQCVTTGRICLRGQVLSEKSERQMQQVRGRDLGMVFQEPMSALNPLMRIGAQVAETLHLHRSLSNRQAIVAAREALDSVGLDGEQGASDRLPYELSGGQRQRVALAMATIMTPALLIADEPTTALDVITQAQVLQLLRRLVRERNMGMILVSHDLAVLAQLADRIAVLDRGTIVEQGPTSQILRGARNPHTVALLAAAALEPTPGMVRAADAPLVLQVADVVRVYPRRRRSLWHAAPPLRAVDGVSLSVHRGETVGLVGESGSGKSSLLKVILALQRPQRGSVRLLDEEFSTARGATLRRLRRGMQGVFQDPYGSFDPMWSVERLIGESFYLLDIQPSAAQRRQKIAAVLEQVGLSAADARRLPREFSGGERQRIAIARALITQPDVIAFDEAVSALDVLIRSQILQLLRELSQRLNVTYLFVSHDLLVIRAIADRVYVMQQGRIVEEGMTQAVFDSPQHAYTRALIAATPTLQGNP